MTLTPDPTFTLPSRLPDVGTTIFSVMSQLALAHNAINLGQGFPNFDPDPALLDAANHALRHHFNQYAPMAGLPALRQVIADKTWHLSGHRYDPEREITVTAGATQALQTAVMAAVQPGDEVIVLEPVYDSYIPAIRMAGAIPVVVAMRAPEAGDPVYRPDWQAVRRAITPRTRALMLNFPHNPTSTILAESDLDALEDLLQDSRILVISDEVYEHIVFDGQRQHSMASRAELRRRSFVVSSFGKTVHATGWKIGYCCAPPALMLEFQRVHQFVVYAVNTPLQQALATFLATPAHYQGLSAFYQAKRDHLVNGLRHTAFQVLPSAGTFFVLADYSQIAQTDADTFSRWLTVTHGVTVIPLSAFYTAPQTFSGRLVRFCFAKTPDTLDQAVQRLQRL